MERQVEIVGEACRRALQEDDELRSRIPEMVLAVAMRNRIAHGYDTVDDTIVFETVVAQFAVLVQGLQRELGAQPP